MNSLQKRTLSGIIFLIVMIGCMVYNPISYCILFAVITALAINEFCNLLNEHLGTNINNIVVTIAGTYLFLATFSYLSGYATEIVFVPYFISLLYIMISVLYSKSGTPLQDWALGFASHIYIALPFSMLNILALNDFGMYSNLPLALFIFLWANDTGAYSVGSLLSKKIPYKLFPSISPNKSWIGSIGGALLVVIVAIIFSCVCQEASVWKWIGLGIVICVFGTWGDLIESQIKRQIKIKDSGNFMPGHGGVLDRFDSSLIAIPAAVIYLILI